MNAVNTQNTTVNLLEDSLSLGLPKATGTCNISILKEYYSSTEMPFEKLLNQEVQLRENGDIFKIYDRAPEPYSRSVLFAERYTANGVAMNEKVALKIQTIKQEDEKTFLGEVAALHKASKLNNQNLTKFIDARKIKLKGNETLDVIVTKFEAGLSFEKYLIQSTHCDEKDICLLYTSDAADE